MIAVEPICPSAEEIRSFTIGRLPTDRFQLLLRHFDECKGCRERIEQQGVATEDSLVKTFAAADAEVDLTAGEPECWAAIRQAAMVSKPVDVLSIPVAQLGPYRLVRCLGSGGMGAVYLAEHTHLARKCAIKLLPRERALDPRWKNRFDREMKAIAAINDPHIVAASDAGQDQGWHYFVMEYLDGLDLGRLAARLPPLAVHDACELVRQAAEGLAHLHEAGLVHRDIKPSNLMLTRSGTVKLLDFGLVFSDAEAQPAADRLTTVGNLMGTLAYMAPEQLVDGRTVDARADLYALGTTLFRLLVGAPPHATTHGAAGVASLVICKTEQPAPALDSRRKDVPSELCELVSRLLKRDPVQRPTSARDVAESLKRWASEADLGRLISAAISAPAAEEEDSRLVSSPMIPQAHATLPPPKRPRLWTAMAAAVPLFLLAGIVVIVKTDRGELVIQSDQPDLKFVIEQGGKPVETLRLDTGDNHLTLRSGTYHIRLEGGAQNVQLSNDQITISRDDRSVITAKLTKPTGAGRREPVPFAAYPSGASAGMTERMELRPRIEVPPVYRGKSVAEWLEVLRAQPQSSELITAITAASELATSSFPAGSADQQKMQLVVAKQILKLARNRYPASSQDKWILGVIASNFRRFMLEPGLTAIEDEISTGDLSSFYACTGILNAWFGQPTIPLPVAPLLQTSEGKQRLDELRVLVDTSVDKWNLTFAGHDTLSAKPEDLADIDSLFRTNIYGLRLRLNNLLGIDSAIDAFTSPILLESINHAAETHKATFERIDKLDGLPPNGWSLVDVSHCDLIIEGNPSIDAEKLVWALMPSTISGGSSRRHSRNQASVTQELIYRWLEKMVMFHPNTVSDSLAVFLSSRKWRSLAFLTSTAPLEPRAWRILFGVYPEHVSKPATAASDLAICVTRYVALKQPDEVQPLLTAALERLRARVKRAADSSVPPATAVRDSAAP